jgi:hypothetical protein
MPWKCAFLETSKTKLEILTGAVDRAIGDLRPIGRSDNAYIAIVAFGGRADLVRDRDGKPFIKSVAQIAEEFPSGLGEYLFTYFHEDIGNIDRGHVDITAALRLAREIYDGAISGDLSRCSIEGAVELIKHDVLTTEKRQIPVPNIRGLIYSGGADNPSSGSPLTNPFESVYPSPLMTAFIGDESGDAGAQAEADQMKILANTCPMHSYPGYFPIDSVSYPKLRGLSRMAATSGFCPQCLREVGMTAEMSK